jgi:hypothetical protein
MGTFDVAGVITIFIYGTASGKNERLKRARILAEREEDDE